MASIIYNSFKRDIMNGSIDLDSDTIKIALVTSSYTPDIDAHDNFDDITNEVSATGYTAGGNTLTTSVTVDTTNDRGVFDASDVSWTASTITARGAVIYKSTGTASTSKLICYVDFGQDYTTNNGTFTVSFNTNGIIYLS